MTPRTAATRNDSHIRERVRTIAARAYPLFALAPFVLALFMPIGLNATLITTSGIALGAMLCVLAAVSSPDRPLHRSLVVALGAAVLTAGWFALSASWAGNARLALYSPRGAGVWVLVAVWLLSGVLVADARALRGTIMATSASGVLLFAATTFEIFTSGYQRQQGYAAGFLENSTSSGTLFSIAVITSVAGVLMSRSTRLRVLFGAAGLISAVGLAMSSSRAGVLGLLASALFALLLARLRIPKSRWWLLSVTPSALALGLTAVSVLVASGSLGQGAMRALALVATQRDAIWRSALAQFAAAPYFGEGAGQFSASIQAGLASIPTATYDTHNLLMTAAVGGGIVGLLAVLATFISVSHATIEATYVARVSPGAVLLASLPVLVLAVSLVAWVDSAALLSVAALLGATLGTSTRRGNQDALAARPVGRGVRLTGGAVGALCLLLAAVNAAPVSVIYESMRNTTTRPTIAKALEYRRRLPEARASIYLLRVLKNEVRAGSPEARGLAYAALQDIKPDARIDVTVAMQAITLALALTDQKDPSGFALVEEMALAGAQADPASGAWYAIAAYDAERRGLLDVAATYASRALAFPQDEATRARLIGIASR